MLKTADPTIVPTPTSPFAINTPATETRQTWRIRGMVIKSRVDKLNAINNFGTNIHKKLYFNNHVFATI